MRDKALCVQCDKEIYASLDTCPFCGAKQDTITIPFRGRKNKTVSILLALFFGQIGMHLFYLKKNVMGVLYFLLSFIPAIYVGMLLINLETLDNSSFMLKPITLELFIILLLIPRMLSFIDMVRYLIMTDREFIEKYG